MMTWQELLLAHPGDDEKRMIKYLVRELAKKRGEGLEQTYESAVRAAARERKRKGIE